MLSSFRHACEGVAIAFREHPNFRIHTASAVVVLLVGFFLHITRDEFLIVIFTINLVFIVEMVNTSVEEITDLITINWSRQAKIAKDVAAGMALLTTAGAAIVGVLIFAPYLLEFIA